MIPNAWYLAMVLAGAVLAAPAAVSPAEPAGAYCIQVEGVHDCLNPCMEVAGAYNAARDTAGAQDVTPDAHCPM